MMTDNGPRTRIGGAAMIHGAGMMSIMTVVVAGPRLPATRCRSQVSRDGTGRRPGCRAGRTWTTTSPGSLNRTDAYALTDRRLQRVALKGPKAGSEQLRLEQRHGSRLGWYDGCNVERAFRRQPSSLRREHRELLEGRLGLGRVDRKVRRVPAPFRCVSRQVAPTDFLYYTDFGDATRRTWSPTPGGSQVPGHGWRQIRRVRQRKGRHLATYWWQGGGRVTNNWCQEIQFAGNDVLDGDVHFNDSH